MMLCIMQSRTVWKAINLQKKVFYQLSGGTTTEKVYELGTVNLMEEDIRFTVQFFY